MVRLGGRILLQKFRSSFQNTKKLVYIRFDDIVRVYFTSGPPSVKKRPDEVELLFVSWKRGVWFVVSEMRECGIEFRVGKELLLQQSRTSLSPRYS